MYTIKNWFVREAMNIITRATLPNLGCKSNSVIKFVTASYLFLFFFFFCVDAGNSRESDSLHLPYSAYKNHLDLGS